MRKNLKLQIRGMVNKLGPELFEDFDKNRLVKKGKVNNDNDNNSNQERKHSITSQDSMVEPFQSQQLSYYHEIALNNVFESLSISF